VYETLRQRPRAIDYYQRAGDRAEALQDWLLAIESYRRLSVVHEQTGNTKASEAAYQYLFELAEKLPPEQNGAARLTEIGKRYWQQQTTSAGRHKTDERLSQLLGANWRRSNNTV
jgi:tetratricopeptide (TPR) repeat protein